MSGWQEKPSRPDYIDAVDHIRKLGCDALTGLVAWYLVEMEQLHERGEQRRMIKLLMKVPTPEVTND